VDRPSDQKASDRVLALRPPKPGGWRRPAETATNQRPEAVAAGRKRLVICADGTWNTPTAVSESQPAPTNVWLLYNLVPGQAADGTPQLAFYHPGVGTGGPVDRLLGGLCGVGIRRNILDCYRFVVAHYRPGDAIYLFGFSRGAYTVRSLAGLIRNCGIIDRSRCEANSALEEVIATAYRLYRSRGDATAPAAEKAVDFRASHSHPDARITCIGVWDTVGALGIPVGLLGRLSQLLFGFHDVTLSSWVERAFHAVAVDERRRPFLPTLWQQQPGAQLQGQRLEQVWFAGAHADVGGGYAWNERGLADRTLRWMINRVSASCGLGFDTAGLDDVARPEAALHDSLRWYYRLVEPPVTRVIDGGLGRYGTRDPFRHTAEVLDDSVRDLARQYESTPIPGVNRPYRPINVRDYDRRLEASRRAGRPQSDQSWRDIRTPGR
jgi:uncharacterized protein (DUF2235 family)